MTHNHAEFGEETLNDDEVTIISSVLECVSCVVRSSSSCTVLTLTAHRLGGKSVKDIMTPLAVSYTHLTLPTIYSV